MTFTYAVFAVPFICAGLYFYGKEGPKNRLLYTAMFGIACAISYFSAFAMLSLILADNMDITDNVDCTADRDCAPHLLKSPAGLLLRKLLMLAAGLIPVNIVYAMEHFVFPGRSVCFWLPDFQYWNLLFEKHCLDGFYWFWLVYIIFITVCPVIGRKSGMSRLSTAAVCGTAVYGIMIFSSSVTPDFVLLLLPFVILLGAVQKNKGGDIADTVLKVIMTSGPVLMCLYSSDYDFGILSTAVTRILSMFEKLGIGSLLGAATFISIIYFIYRRTYYND